MKYYLGIDGGGTKTTYLVIDENGKQVDERTYLGTAIDTYSMAEVKKRLVQGITEAPYEFAGVFAGLGGITCEEDCDKINAILKSCKNVKGPVGSNNDVSNALAGALAGEDGIVLIAGTGSVAYGKNGDKTWRAGGYGYLEGDAGSSYDLGRQALKYLARVIDKRFKRSSFTDAMMDATKCYNFSDLAKYFNTVSRADTAQLAMVVTSYYKNHYAKRIIEYGVDQVLEMVTAVFRECGFKKAKLSIIGGLGNANTVYRQTLLEKLPKTIEYVPYKKEAAMGAAILAKQLATKK